MIDKPKPFWSPEHHVLPAEPPKKLRPKRDVVRWLLGALLLISLECNLGWYVYWKKTHFYYVTPPTRIYTTVQGPCIQP